MAKKKKEKNKIKIGFPQRTFQVLNTLLILLILGFYLYRAIDFRNQFIALYSEVTSEEHPVYLSEALISKVIGDNDGVWKDENENYHYRGNPKYNYVSYSGRIFRVLDINTDGEVRMVEQDNTGSFILDDSATYSESLIRQWLNTDRDDQFSGIYQKSLRDFDTTMIRTEYCTDVIDGADSIGCKYTKNDNYVTMLSLNDYKMTGGADGFLNNGEGFMLISMNSDNENWFVNEDGSLSTGSNPTQFVGVRAVVTTRYDLAVQGGTGRASDPFIVRKSDVNEAKDMNISTFISYSGRLWRVVRKTNELNIELMLDGYLTDENGEPITRSFGSSNQYSPDRGLGYYLNSDYLESLENYENVLISNDWYYGSLSGNNMYDYHDNFDNTLNCYVALPNTAVQYVDEYPGIFIMANIDTNDDLVYTIDDDGHLFAGFLSSENKIRPMICINGSLAIESGSGTRDNPYVLAERSGE